MTSSSYIDGLVGLEAYQAVARMCSEVWKEHGALRYVETVLDDPECMGMRPFIEAAGAAEDEAVIFSWVEYPSKEARDEANAKIMSDPRISELGEKTQALFDCQRMSFGGFKPIVVF